MRKDLDNDAKKCWETASSLPPPTVNAFWTRSQEASSATSWGYGIHSQAQVLNMRDVEVHRLLANDDLLHLDFAHL